MTNPQIPSYSGVTINISNPTVNANPYSNSYSPVVSTSNPNEVTPQITSQIPQQEQIPQMTAPQQAYPPQYYLNNYANNTKNSEDKTPLNSQNLIPQASSDIINNKEDAVEDMSSSSKIINNINEQAAKQKQLEETGKQTRIVALTDEYIKSLENYLNNQNTEIRVMAAKEILTRLDEDKSRYDDAALNALLNKMLQDPQKLVRIAALSALSSGLASGNEYTVQLLNNIQQNPNSDKDDVVEAANILLKMSSDTEIRYTPTVTNNNPEQNQKAKE